MEEQKQHDWGTIRILNPDKQIEYLLYEGFTPENTSIESREFYKNKNKIQEIFSKEDGTFDEDLFNKWYDMVSLEHEYLSYINVENAILDNYEKELSNVYVDFGKPGTKQMDVEIVANPQGQSFGTKAWDEWSEPKISQREAAQNNYWWDNEKQQWSTETVNEAGALGKLFGKSLVYATYDNDVFDERGVKIHSKGEWKTDAFGNYYTETIDNAEAIGKQFVTLSEVITDDGSFWNKLDPFDSDDINKSVARTVYGGLVTVGSMLIPYAKIGQSIQYATAAVNFARVLPQISKTFVSLFDSDLQFDKLNSWDNYMKQFKISKSDRDSEHFFTLNNAIDMAVDSFTQLAQQRAIAKLPESLGFYDKAKKQVETAQMATLLSSNSKRMELLKKNPQLMESLVKAHPIYRKAEKSMNNLRQLSDVISKSYMVATSTEDSYNTARSYGFDTQTASIISLATYAGIAMLFQNDYFRGMLYNTKDYDLQRDVKVLVKSYLENNKDKIAKEAAEAIGTEAKKNFLKRVGDSVMTTFKQHVSDMKSGHFSIGSAMLSEGIEETIEEITQDTATQIGIGWLKLKEIFTGEKYDHDYKYLETDPLQRYATAFAGGALGGAIFKLSDRIHFEKSAYSTWKNMLKNNSEISKEFVKLISQNKTQLILDTIAEYEKTPILSTKISAFNDAETDRYEDSQNGVLFNTFKKAIIDLDQFIGQKGLKIDYSEFGDIEVVKGIRAAWINAEGLQDSLFNDYLKEVGKIANEYAIIQSLRSKKSDNMESTEKESIDSQIKEHTEKINDLTNNVRKLITGSDDSYIGRLMMQSNPNISQPLRSNSRQGMSYLLYGVDYDMLSDYGKSIIDEKLKKFKDSWQEEIDYYELWNVYKTIHSNEDLTSLLNNFVDKTSNLNSNITGKQINEIGRLHDLKIKKSSDLQDKHIQFGLLSKLAKLYNIDINDGALAVMLGVKELPFKIDDGVFTDIDADNLAELFSKISKSIDATIETLKTQLQEISKGKLSTEMTDKTQLILYNMFGGNDLDTNKIIDLLNIFKNNVNEFNVLEYLGTSFTENLNGTSFDSELSKLINKFSELLGVNLDDEEVVKSIIDEYILKSQAGKDYRMESSTQEKFNSIKELLDNMTSFLSGAYDKYNSQLLGVPFGANNMLNEEFASKKIGIKLNTINGNSLTLLLNNLSDVKAIVDDIIEADRQNRSDVIKEDMTLSINLSYCKIEAIKDLIDKGVISSDYLDFNEELPTRPNGWENLSYDEAKEILIKNRNILIKFENAFSKIFKDGDISSCEAIISKIVDYCGKENISDDTSKLITGKSEIFSSVDIFHYLFRISLNNINAIESGYKKYVNSTTSVIPYDSQEEIIKYGCAVALYKNKDIDLFELWLKHCNSQISVNLHNQQGTITAERVLNWGLKASCAGGVGKTKAIIPAIKQIISSINPNAQLTFVTNTSNQAISLKEGVNQDVLTFNDAFGNLNDETFDKYIGHVIVFDESTQINLDDLMTICAECKKRNIPVLIFGDLSQAGKPINLDHAITLQTPMLTESKRSGSDIDRINIRKLSNLSNTNSTSYVNSLDGSLLYWDEDKFNGIKLNEDVNVDYIENFINEYGINSGKILIFTNDVKSYERLIQQYSNISFELCDDIEQIQGFEWEYVFTDIDFNIDDKIEIVSSINSENVSIPGVQYEWKKIYTLLTRHINGFIGKNITINGQKFESEKSIRKPILLEISDEVKSQFKQFKTEVLNGIEILNENVVEENPQKVNGGVIIPTITNYNYHTIQASPAFLPIFDTPNNSFQEREIIRNILNDMLINDDAENLLPDFLKGGEFVIMFKRFDKDKLDFLGNEWRDGKSLPDMAPWLTYKKGNIDIPIALFHSPDNTEVIPSEAFAATHALHKLVQYEDMDENDRNQTFYFKLPDNVKFKRPNNLISIQNHESGNNTVITYDVIAGRVVAQGFDAFDVTPPVYGDTRLFENEGHLPIGDINKLLNDQRVLYKNIFDRLVSLNIIDAKGNINENAYFDDLTQIIKLDRRNRKYIPKGVPFISEKFITFVRYKFNANSNTISLQECANQYKNWVNSTNEWLSNVLNELNSIDSIDNLDYVKSALSNTPQSTVSIVVFKPTDVREANDVKSIISNLRNTSSKRLVSYNQSITSQIALMLHHLISDEYKTKTKVLSYLNNLDIQELTNIVNDIINSKNLYKSDYINSINRLYQFISDNTSLQELLVHIYSKQNTPKEYLITNDFVKRINDSLSDSDLKLHRWLLKDNGISIFTPIATEVIVDRQGSLNLEGKILQRAQIHMLVYDNAVYEPYKSEKQTVSIDPSTSTGTKQKETIVPNIGNESTIYVETWEDIDDVNKLEWYMNTNDDLRKAWLELQSVDNYYKELLVDSLKNNDEINPNPPYEVEIWEEAQEELYRIRYMIKNKSQC